MRDTQRKKPIWILAPVAIALIVAGLAFHLYRSTTHAFEDQLHSFEHRSFVLEAAATFSRAYSNFELGIVRQDSTLLTKARFQLESAAGHLRDAIRHSQQHPLFDDHVRTRQLLAQIDQIAARFRDTARQNQSGDVTDPAQATELFAACDEVYRQCRAAAVDFEITGLELAKELETRGRKASLFLVALVTAMAALIVVLSIYVRLQRRTQESLAVARQLAEHASRSKSEFLANMSHEIRTPMTAILGFAENLADPGISSQERGHCVQTIQRNGDYLLSIINDILDLSKIEAGKMTVEKRRCSPSEILSDVVELIEVRARAKGLKFSVEFEGPLPEAIDTDPIRLRQILINLAANATKFTEIGSVTIVCRTAQKKSGVMLEFDITDTGIGLEMAEVRRLFQPFSQQDSSMTRRYGGTGLGLSISRKFARLLGGDLRVVRSKHGVGTTFRATIAVGRLAGVRWIRKPQLPRRRDSKPAVAIDGTPLFGRHLLLVEDGPDNQVLIAHVLKKAGATVTVAANGQQAIDAVLGARRPFDAILMDMQMPVVDGYQATRTLREHDYKGTIIALTAHAMAGDRQKCLQAGCDGYATKPIDRMRLIELILLHLDPISAKA